MRKFQKVAVVAAMLGSISFLGAGVSQAHGDEDGKFKVDSKQGQQCSANDVDFVGSETGSETFAPINTAGLQLNDNSEHHSVNCNQLFAIGH